MNEEEFKRAHEEGVKVLTAVLAMMKVHGEEAGMDKAHELLSKWTTFFMGGALQQMKEAMNVTEKTPKAFYTVMETLERSIGGTFEIIDETPEKIPHKIHGCVFREACMQLGLDPIETCQKAIAPITHNISAVVNPDLEWKITKCNPDPEPCVYEIRYRKTE